MTGISHLSAGDPEYRQIGIDEIADVEIAPIGAEATAGAQNKMVRLRTLNGHSLLRS